MALTVTAITPSDADNNVAIDRKIIIEFNGPVDPFTVAKGISVYCDVENLWSGPDLASLDSKYRDVLEIGKDYAYYPYSYTIVGNIVTLSLGVSMLPDKQHYVSVLPGNDASRYISEPTTGVPVYNKANPLDDGAIEILSPYNGTIDGVYTVAFNAADKIDVVFEGNYLGEFIYTPNEEVNLGDISISISGAWALLDEATIPVFKATGVDAIYKSVFTTTKYETLTPTSVRIEEKLKAQSVLNSLKIVGTIPQGLSVNNDKCNPIVLKFSAPVDELQDFVNSIRVSKTSLTTGRIKAVKYYVKAVGDTVKIYLVGVDNSGTVDHAINLDEVVQRDLRERLNILGG
jgi:hypothetical protein